MSDLAWSCLQCTLINAAQDTRCAVCGAENPSKSRKLHGNMPKSQPTGGGVLSKIKDKLEGFVPSASTINSALERIDTALDVFASPSPNRSAYGGGAASSSQQWTCPKCSQMNPYGMRQCTWCAFDRRNDPSLDCWTCAGCGLEQPQPPPSEKCPLCRRRTTNTGSSGMAAGKRLSASLPQLYQPDDGEEMVTGNQVQNENLALAPQFDDELSPVHSTKYNEIIEFCRASVISFVDDSFPHSMRSIGPLSHLEDGEGRQGESLRRALDSGSLIWLRPANIVTKDGFLARWSVFNDPQPTDIEQGLLGNCWFISALAVVAERPDVLEKLFLTKEYNHLGVYEIRLCVDGLWQTILVDDFFPCHKRQRSMVFAVGRKNQLWVSLVEKALAKAYGSYTQLRAGRTVEGLSTLTGAPCIYIDLEQPGTEPGSSQQTATLDLIWAKLLSAREAGFIMGCSCGAGKRVPDEKEFRRVGLWSRHAYSILDVRVVDGERLLRLRNPWGQFIWLGEWSWQWPGWNAARRRAAGPAETWRQPGTFWIPFPRFMQFFDSVDIAQIHPTQNNLENEGRGNGWTAARYPVPVGWNDEGASARVIRLTVTEPTVVSVVVHQRGARTNLDQVDLLVIVHREAHGPSFSPQPGELVCRSPRRTHAFSATEEEFLAPGDYIVCAHSFARFAEGRPSPGTIVVHSSRKIFTEALDVPQTVLRDSMIQLLLKEGTQETSLGMTRYITEQFEGLAMMVDNPLPDRCLHVHSDCTESSNVLSTRCALSVADSVPPLHRQLLLVLTHFEPSQPFELHDFAPDAPTVQHHPTLMGAASSTLHGPHPIFN